PRLRGATQTQVLDVRRRLSEPLRIAIAGRLKAGKSTLVNALIGRRVAPTEVGECTRIVTQFRYGTADRVDVVRRDGSRVSLPLDESGMIPQRLGVPRGEISYVDVALTSDPLSDLRVVDTPGLSSANPVAADQASVLRRVVSDVVPIVGLLAETTEAGRLTAADCEALRTLAGLSDSDRTVLLASVDLFASRECPISREARERLLRLLDLYGIGFAIAHLVANPGLATSELIRLLHQVSGFPRLRETLNHAFRWRSDAIKAGWA